MKMITTSLLAVYFIIVAPACYSSNDTSRLVCDGSNFCIKNNDPSSKNLFKLTAHDTPFHRHNEYAHRGRSMFNDGSFFTTFASSKRTATGNNVFIFDPKKLRWYAYDRNGSLVGSGAASGGKHYCADVGRRCKTPIGTFKVHRKGSAYCKSSKYPLGRGGAPMPYCMFFHRGYAIHGSPDVPNHNASHGCIRVKPPMARWLHANHIGIGTTVIVRPY